MPIPIPMPIPTPRVRLAQRPCRSAARNGRAAAVLVSHDEFESWKETAALLSDREFREEIRAGMTALRTRRARTFRGKDLDRRFRDEG